MSHDLPIYSDSPLRTSLQFADLDRLKGGDDSSAWLQGDAVIAAMEDAQNIASARAGLRAASKDSLLTLHAALFPGRSGSGRLRTSEAQQLYRGQDCAPPEFIERSIDNLMSWLAADSFSQIHPIERCALTITRIVDVWPFEIGNLTTAIVFGNLALADAGLTPFFVQPQHRAEFERVMALAMTIDTQPLVNAIYATVKKEMAALAKR